LPLWSLGAAAIVWLRALLKFSGYPSQIRSADDRRVVQSILGSPCSDLAMIAEGVEDQATLDLLSEPGPTCTGLPVGRPVPLSRAQISM